VADARRELKQPELSQGENDAAVAKIDTPSARRWAETASASASRSEGSSRVKSYAGAPAGVDCQNAMDPKSSTSVEHTKPKGQHRTGSRDPGSGVGRRDRSMLGLGASRG
jgi:hypothetical protein